MKLIVFCFRRSSNLQSHPGPTVVPAVLRVLGASVRGGTHVVHALPPPTLSLTPSHKPLCLFFNNTFRASSIICKNTEQFAPVLFKNLLKTLPTSTTFERTYAILICNNKSADSLLPLNIYIVFKFLNTIKQSNLLYKNQKFHYRSNGKYIFIPNFLPTTPLKKLATMALNPDKRKEWIVIGVSGVTCGGKTTLANKLRDTLTPVYVFHQDKYFYADDSPKHVRCAGLAHNNYDILSALDMEGMYKDVLETINGGDKSHQANKERAEGQIEVRGKKFLIVEGFTVLNYKPLLEICDVR